jgi:hypothetical protein
MRHSSSPYRFLLSIGLLIGWYLRHFGGFGARW